ncbi:hypothetical protein Fmac_004629 [Flemingia macrophylla]|uniref:Uncharacterized protein n=1 Tax=Flemingia macrophylla TaxID=520843 RepID=A0ABD1N5G6_9FABA
MDATFAEDRTMATQQVPYEDDSPPIGGFSQEVAQIILQDGETLLYEAQATCFNELDRTPSVIKDHFLKKMMLVLTQPDIFMVGLYETNYRRKSNMIEKIIRRE